MESLIIFSARYLFVVPIIILGAYFFIQRRPAQKRMALFAVPAGLLAYALGLLAGFIYYDPRPFVSEHIIPLIRHAADNGFPSDHTLLAATLASVGTYWNKRIGLILWIFTILIAMARVYAGVHHAIDVLASMAIAIIAVSAWHALIERVGHTPHR